MGAWFSTTARTMTPGPELPRRQAGNSLHRPDRLASTATRHPTPTRGPVEGVLDAIGNTPLVSMKRYLDLPEIHVWAKLEAGNPGGSAKARPAAQMLTDALERGLIGPGSTVIESTSGNMGVGLAQACAYHRMKLICVVDSRTHETNTRTLRALGADVRVVSRPEPATGDLLAARLALVQHLIEITPNSYWPNQYANSSNPAAHAEGTMREIDEALGGELDYIFVATSTTGTLRGCHDYLREQRRDTQVVAVDAVGSSLFGGVRSTRRLPGFGAGVETELSKSAEFAVLMRVSDLDCVVGCRRLVRAEAIFAGASSGGVAVAMQRLAPSMPPGSRCAIVCPDGGVGYLETVYDDDWVNSELGCSSQDLAARVGAIPQRPTRTAA